MNQCHLVKQCEINLINILGVIDHIIRDEREYSRIVEYFENIRKRRQMIAFANNNYLHPENDNGCDQTPAVMAET